MYYNVLQAEQWFLTGQLKNDQFDSLRKSNKKINLRKKYLGFHNVTSEILNQYAISNFKYLKNIVKKLVEKIKHSVKYHLTVLWRYFH